MVDEDTEDILLQCVDAVTGVKITRLSHLVQHEHFNKFISKLRENILSPTNFKDASPHIQSSLKEYFLNDNLVDFCKAGSGDNKELMKLVLLLLYTAFIADKDIRTLLSNTLNHQLQLKLKYLFECIQKRESGLSVKYLDILISEKLEQRCSSSHGVGSNSSSGSQAWRGASPVLYTSSPKAASHQSPLKELLQSPTFRIQRKLESRVKDVKRLNKELNDLENEKAEWLVEKQVNSKKSAKLEQELRMLREQHLELRLDRDNLETRVLGGKDQINEQAQKLGRELALARSENCTLQQTLKEVMDKNDELSTKEEAAHIRLTSALKEREQIEMQLIEVREQHHLTTGLLDEKEHLLQQHLELIQYLEVQLQEARPLSRPHNFTIESLDASQAYPMVVGIDSTAQAPSSPISQSGCENMGTAVVDLMLQETRQQLQALQEQHSALQHKMQAVQQHNELTSKKLADSVQQCSSLQSQINSIQVAKEHTDSQLQTVSAKCEEQNCKLAEYEQQKQQMESCVHELQEKLGQLQQQVLLGTEQLQQLRQQLEETTTQLVESSHHARGLSSQLEEVVKQKAGVERDYTETVAALKAENSLSLEQLKQATQLKVSQLEDNLLSTKSELSRVSELYASSSTALDEQQRRVAETTQQLQAAQLEVAELDKQRAKLLLEGQQQQQVQQDRLRDVTNEMEQKIAEKDKRMMDVKTKLCGEIQEQKNSLELKENENRRLAEKLTELKAESEQLICDALEKVEELAEDRDAISNKMKEIEITMASEASKANSELTEVKTAFENKCRDVESLTSNFESNVKNLKNELIAKDAIVQALNKSVCDLQKSVKAKECSLEQTKEEFKMQTETMLQEKEKIIKKIEEESSASKQNEKRFQEKVQLLESSRAKYETELKAVESRIEGLRHDNEEKTAKLMSTDSIVQQLRDELDQLSKQIQTSAEEAEQLREKLLQVEASLIDKEKEYNAAKEDVMRVERVAENDVHSLKQEMAGLKKKYKDDKQAYEDKMKTVFKDQIAKLMAEVEKYKTISDDCKLLEQKYEAAKHKLAQAYADLSDATTAKDDYYQQMNRYKEHVSRLRESVQQEQQQRQAAEFSCEPLRAQLAEAASDLKRLQADKQSLEARLATADSKIRELNRNWSRESLGGPSNGSTIRAVVSESTLTSSSGVASARVGQTRSIVTGRLGPDGRQQAGAGGRRDPSATRPSGGGATSRAGGTAFTASYRKAVGRASTVRGPTSSSAEEDVLDGSYVPLLTRNTRSASSVLPTSSTKGPEKAKSSDGLFRKPSIRITATDDRTRAKTPVELRALSSLLDEEDGEEGEDEELWEKDEKMLQEEKVKKAVEGERKKKLALLRDQQARRMTVDGRIIKDEITGNFPATPASGSKRRSMTRSVPRGLGTFFSCEDEDQEFFSNKYLQDMKVGRCVVNPSDVRMSELQRRNSLYPPHMRSSYAAEMQFNPLQDKLDPVTNMLLKEDAVKDLASATERLVIESPAFNLRKRKTLSDSLASNDSLENSLGKKVRRLSTSYSRPGPPTPGRKSIGRVDKENKRMSLRSHGSPSVRSLASSISSSSLGSSRRVSRSPALSAVGSTPAAKRIGGSSSSGSGGSPTAGASANSGRMRGAPTTPGSVSVTSSRRYHHTPASIKRLIKGKSPWKKLTDGAEGARGGRKQRLAQRFNRALKQTSGQS